MNTPTETRTIRPNFWLRTIEVRKHKFTREYRKTLGTTAQHRKRGFGHGRSHRHPGMMRGFGQRPVSHETRAADTTES